MIDSIRGRAGERGDDWVIVDLGAVSLRVNTTRGTVASIGAPGTAVSLCTYLYLREDVVVLYGFSSPEEREVFERLLGVTGVGPRAAQAMLSTMAPAALREAIERENVDALVRVPGIGRKTAQRVILELKGKLVPLGAPAAAISAPADNDLVAVLVGLGYSAAEAGEALRSVPAREGLSDEDRLRAALRHFAAPR
jgi:Holliday junction DNA helicase RuvA